MSRVSGNKRKQVGADAVASSSSANLSFASVEEGEDIYNLDIEHAISKAIENVKNGVFPELQKRTIVLERLKEKQIAAADRHRKQQILNINQLFEYEVEDAKALYNKAYQELQEQLVAELNEEKQRLAAIQRQLQNDHDDSKSSSNLRALRSTAISYSDADGAPRNGARGGKKRAGKADQIPMVLEEVLEEESRRMDLLEIVRDLKARSTALETHKDAFLSVSINDEMSAIYIGDSVFEIGDTVMIKSSFSAEEFVGILTAISTREVVLRTGSGPRISFQISQIQGGRVSITMADLESI